MQACELEVGEDKARLKLASTLDMRAAGPLKAGLEEAMATGKPVEIDASDVERLLTPAVQVLLAAVKSFEAKQVPYALKAPSDEFGAAFSDLGLFSVLMRWNIES